nr:MAG: hypothetical protein 2 [Tombusviridae sp.]
MDSQTPQTVNRGRSKERAQGKDDSKGSLKRRVATDAIAAGEGSALGTMVIQAETVTMTINFNF